MACVCPELLIQIDSCRLTGTTSAQNARGGGHTIPFLPYPPTPLKSYLFFTQPSVSQDLPLA